MYDSADLLTVFLFGIVAGAAGLLGALIYAGRKAK